MRLDLSRALVLAPVLSAAVGCASLSPLPAPQVTATQDFVASAPGVTREAATEPAWWTRFGDPVLDDLVLRALDHNRDLAAQLETVEASRAIRRLRRAEELPRGGPRADVERRRLSSHEAGGASRRVDTLAVGFDAGWELDLFGRAHRTTAAAAERQAMAEAGLAHSRLVLAAEVVRTYVELRGAEARIGIRRRARDDQAELVELNRVLASEGRISTDVTARARAELRAQEAELADDEETLAVLTHALAVLVAEAPGRFELPAAPAAGPLRMEAIALGDPASLLRRRPDVQAAERAVAAERLDVASAGAEWFPRVSLGGFLGLVAGSGSDLGSSGAAAWSVGPSLSWDVLGLGRVRARVQAERAEARAALARYEQAVLRALEETENAITTYRVAQDRLRARVAQAEDAHVASDAVSARYEEGASDHLGVLLARRDALAADLDRVDAIVLHRVAVVALFKALGAVPAVRGGAPS